MTLLPRSHDVMMAHLYKLYISKSYMQTHGEKKHKTMANALTNKINLVFFLRLFS